MRGQNTEVYIIYCESMILNEKNNLKFSTLFIPPGKCSESRVVFLIFIQFLDFYLELQILNISKTLEASFNEERLKSFMDITTIFTDKS